MSINISHNVTQAMAEGRLTMRQITQIAEAHNAGSFMPDSNMQIQFDRDRGTEVLRGKDPCKASLYVKELTGLKRFTSRFGNPTNQLGLHKFIHDFGTVS